MERKVEYRIVEERESSWIEKIENKDCITWDRQPVGHTSLIAGIITTRIFTQPGEPKNIPQLKAKVGDTIEIIGYNRYKLERGLQGIVYEVLNRRKKTEKGEYSDWKYRVSFPEGKHRTLLTGIDWKVIK